MKYWVSFVLLVQSSSIVFTQDLDSTYGRWWVKDQVYKVFTVEAGKTYHFKGAGYYDFWHNGSAIKTIRNDQGDYILHVSSPTNNNRVYARKVQHPVDGVKLDRLEISKDSFSKVSEYTVEKHFIYREYYCKETIGPEQLLRKSPISKNESWGKKPTYHEQILLEISDDTSVQHIDLRIRNLGYVNDLEVYLDQKLIRISNNIMPYEDIKVEISKNKGLGNFPNIEIKSKYGPQRKFSVVGLKITGIVQAMPKGSFKLNLNENRLFIPCDSNEAELKIMNREDGLYYTPQAGRNGWGFYLSNCNKDKLLTTLSYPITTVDLDTVKEITFNEEGLSKSEYLIIVAEEILKNQKAKKQLEDYIAFRNTTAGGNYSINWMNYETIYHHYGYGEKNSYKGLFNYFRKLKSRGLKPKIVWLIGKGYGQDYKDEFDHLIPSYGYPASDFLLVNEIDDTNNTMVARLAATNGASLVDYLQKVMDYELAVVNGPQNWRKNVLHIAGGKNVEELNTNKDILRKAWDPELSQKLGMKLSELSKPIIERNPSNFYGEFLDRLNKGLGIRVFLGHGGVTSTELGLDNPDLLSSVRKFPLMMDLGCQTGDIFTRKKSLSEQFTFASYGGAIGYIGSSGYGYSSGFSSYLSRFYLELSNNIENQSIGKIFFKAILLLQESNFYGSQILGYQLNFHGDPFLKLFNTGRPDYRFSNISSTMEPSKNQLLIEGNIINVGRLQKDTIEILFQVGDIELKRDTAYIMNESTTFQTNLSVPTLSDFINKQLSINCRQVQNEKKLLEQDTLNNLHLEKTNGLIGLIELKYPFNHSIISSDDLLGLFFQVNYPGEFWIELDTTPHFFHPKRFFKSVKEAPTLSEIKLESNQLINNQRYYWRVNENTASTFFYSEDKKGIFFFNQRNQLKSLPTQQKFESFSVLVQAVVRTEDNQLRSRLFRDGLRLVNSGVPVAFYVVVIEPTTGRLVHNKKFEANADNYQVLELVAFLEEEVERNYLVSIFTFHHKGQSFKNGPIGKSEDHLIRLSEILKQEGARDIGYFLEHKDIPYLIVFQKGKGIIKEVVGTEDSEKVEVLINMGDWLGIDHYYRSSLFGPSEKWDSVHMISDLKGLKLSGQEKEGENEDWIAVNSSMRLDKRINHKDYLSFWVDGPINELEIEFFGQRWKNIYTSVFLEQDSIIEGQPIHFSLNEWRNALTHSTPTSLCLTLLGENIKRDTCIALTFSNGIFFQQHQIQLWSDIPVGNYQLLSDWNENRDSLSLFVKPFIHFPELSLLINGQVQVPMQSFKSGKRMRIQIKSIYNHFLYRNNPKAAMEVRLKDASGNLQEVDKDQWKVEVDLGESGLNIQLDGTIKVNRNGIYTLEVIPKTINGVLLESLKETAVIDVFLSTEIEKINFFPNPFSEQLGLSFYYWGDQIPASFTVAILNMSGNVVKEVDLVQTRQIQMGRNVINDLFKEGEDWGGVANSAYSYLVKVNNKHVFSGRLINIK
ncbi:MAG: hypothetical protein RLZZ248_1096 [Bacteroidota bacterium]